MKVHPVFLSFLLGLLLQTAVVAQTDPGLICRIENGNLVFKIDQRWNDSLRKEVSRLYDLDSILLTNVFNGKPFIRVDSVTWQVHLLSPGLAEISKMIAPEPPQFTSGHQDFILFDNFWTAPPSFNQDAQDAFGINQLTDPRAFSYQDGTATFFLPRYSANQKIYLSGSFNAWSTMQLPMQKNDSGWIIRISLPPGRYSYKYIIDGKWSADPGNKQKEDDTYGGHNSIVYCPNYLFRLDGHTDARNVILSGSFNNWNEKELKMQRTASGWQLPVYLREGTHSYKFIVDKQWIVDPDNPLKRDDGNGNINSFIALGDTLLFRLKGHLEAKQVILSGSFNNWSWGELKMLRDSTGWYLPYVLAKGNYEYKFIVDGNWMPDPQNPYSTGQLGKDNSFVAIKPNHVFQLEGYPDAKKVVVAGSFNGWDEGKYCMSRQNGNWVFPLYLNPGKYTYKFIVDGNWILDPANELWEENEYNTDNSVLWINEPN